MENHSTITVRNLVVTFGERRVVDIPSLEVLPGEVLVIIGPNGAGKTTLLLCLTLLMKPASGTIYYGNEQIASERQMLQVRRRLAAVFQEPLLLATTVQENVRLGLRFRGVPKSEARARTQHWLERFGVARLAKRQARTLSSGEAKRVSLARAFALEPEVLFLDEPFAALDSPTRQALIEDFERVVHETNTTTVMVTHDRNEALALADRVAVLVEGRIRQMGTPEAVFNFPVDEAVASFVEAGNILSGRVAAQNEGLALVETNGRQIEAVSSLPAATRVTVCLRHEDVTLSLSPAEITATSARNRFTGVVLKTFPLGSQVRVTLDCGFPLVALITKRSREGMGLETGQKVTATFKASSIHLIPHQ